MHCTIPSKPRMVAGAVAVVEANQDNNIVIVWTQGGILYPRVRATAEMRPGIPEMLNADGIVLCSLQCLSQPPAVCYLRYRNLSWLKGHAYDVFAWAPMAFGRWAEAVSPEISAQVYCVVLCGAFTSCGVFGIGSFTDS